MFKRLLLTAMFAAFSTAVLAAADLPKLVVQQPAAAKKNAPAPTADQIANNLVQAFTDTREYDVGKGVDPPDTGYFVVSIVQHTAKTKLAAATTVAKVLLFEEPGGRLQGEQDIDITGRSAPYISVSEAQSVFQAHPVLKGQPQIVLMNDGLQSTNPQTANTSFSGPAYVESRLVEDLLQESLLAVPIGDYLAEGTDNKSTTFTSNDDAFREACARNARLIGLRYVLAYQETINPLFGTQNADATLDTRLQQCGQDVRNITPFRVTSNAHNIGSSGLLNPQYFRLLNWGLTGARKNRSWTGLLGTTGDIVSSLMPPTAQYAAAATAVGNTSKSTACATSYFMLIYQSQLGDYIARRQSQLTSKQGREVSVSEIQKQLTPSRNDLMISETYVPKLTNEGFAKNTVCKDVQEYQRDLKIYTAPTPAPRST